MPHIDAGSGFLIPALILMVAALALTAFRVDVALARNDGENLFWVGLTGLLTALLAVAWAVAGNPEAGPWIGLAAVAGATGAASWVRVRNRRRGEKRRRSERRQRIAELERRHESVLLSWSAYELDDWKAMEKPGLQDAAKPETRALLRAMKAAAALRPAEGSAAALSEAELGNYGAAVAGLEKAWESAEATAGGGQAA
ncbi:hypothetical protein QNO08_00605 [Arthrobacter sp. zg-Y820]|uniref:hypothetical protein n=1 Tax=unclassified Arthrobacter TaxID=235627 RepID=UPI001E3E7A65|nr:MULTISPECIES: hypothetical protein [unclassified Arthrobacter]MCC9197484.1 hypothetical protein [Arthrobacter sp. zg-Y820]MDK1280351.1 hypothetical protein [Arthrobacter sp. zg.Y820]MDK1360514.1 hypothetical protein [Arthrobacter sp. zg-Y1219]WIB09634.1 hypothetical protein QNO08_00605 [Arthrobacter sp. zg-Y820]